jgi:hypothetical protein
MADTQIISLTGPSEAAVASVVPITLVTSDADEGVIVEVVSERSDGTGTVLHDVEAKDPHNIVLNDPVGGSGDDVRLYARIKADPNTAVTLVEISDDGRTFEATFVMPGS